MTTRRSFLKKVAATAAGLAIGSPAGGNTNNRPDVLVITVDDMYWKSPGAFGNPIPGITPNIDRLANEGMRFERAHVTCPVCLPSRESMFSGTWPHNNGSNAGFFSLNPQLTTLHEQMKKAGYFIGQVGKMHLSPGSSFPTDYRARLKKDLHWGRFPSLYRKYTRECFEAANESGKPFFGHVGIMDPHTPYAGRDHLGPKGTGELWWSGEGPSAPFTKKVKPSFVPLPPYADLIKEDPRPRLAAYYDSVYRADQSVGAVLEMLKQSGRVDNTVVIFLNDHGWMMGDHGKLTLFPDGTKSPLIVRWPGVVKPGSVEENHFLSMMDLTPTVIDITGAPASPDVADAATSFRPLLLGQSQPGGKRVFTEYNGGYGGKPMRFFHPERAVLDGRRLYYFRPHFYNGIREEDMYNKGEEHQVQEFYDLKKDPHATRNVINDPEYRDEVSDYRQQLLAHLQRTNDLAARALAHVNSTKALEKFMKEERRIVKKKA